MSGGIHSVVVRRGLATHQSLPQSGYCIDNQQIAPAAYRVGSEDHPGHAGINHALHNHVHRDHSHIDMILLIVSGAIGSGRGHTTINRLPQLAAVSNVEYRVILPGERSINPILTQRRGTHGDLVATQRNIMLIQISRITTRAGIANNKGRRHRQPHSYQPRQAIGLTAKCFVANLLQPENVSSQTGTPTRNGLIQFIFMEATVFLQAPVFFKITGEKKRSVTCRITVIAVAVTGTP